MATNFKNNVELVVNIMLGVAVCVVTGIALKNYLFGAPAPAQQQQSQVVAGAKINIPGVNWAENQKTLIFFLKKDCPYCKSSAPFYRELAEDASGRDVRLLAIVPHSADEGRDYIRSLGLPIGEVKEGSFESYKIPGAPTVLFADSSGTVRRVWVGAVGTEREQEVRESFAPLFEATPQTDPNGPSATAGPGQSAGPPAGLQDVAVAEELGAAELKQLIESKRAVVIVDIDQRDEYRKEHIPNSINIPEDEILVRARRELPQDRTVVLYCRCDAGGSATHARGQLRKQGLTRVSVLKGGLLAWKGIGAPVEPSRETDD